MFKKVLVIGTGFPDFIVMQFIDKDGREKPVWFGSYGIGPTRVMGALVEVFHDNKGIIWPESVAPFAVQLIVLSAQDAVLNKSQDIYERLQGAGVEVLFDDTDRSAGEKFADADLIGIPVRLVVSEKTGDKVEWKGRGENKSELVEINAVLSRLDK